MTMRYCYNCGALAEHNGIFCAACGGKIDAPGTQPNPTATVQPVQQPYNVNIYNTYNTYTQPVPEQKAPVPSPQTLVPGSCPYCGAIVRHGFEGLCPNCGIQIKPETTTPVQQEMPVSKASVILSALLALAFVPLTLLMLLVTIAGLYTEGISGMVILMLIITSLSGSASYIGIKNLHRYDKQKKLRWRNHQLKLDYQDEHNNQQPRIM